MQCSKCGKKLKEGMTVCPACGTGINGEEPIKVKKQKEEAKKHKDSFEKKIMKGRKALLIFMAALLVIAFGTAAVVLATQNMRDYKSAVAAYEDKRYDEAELTLEKLADKNYKDSVELLKNMRYEWVDSRMSVYDYIGAERYVNTLDESLDYKADLRNSVLYKIAELHETENPAIAQKYYQDITGYKDADERAEKAGEAAKEMGQSLSDFDNPEAPSDLKNAVPYFKISVGSFDDEASAENFKNEVEQSGKNLRPYIEQLEGKYQVLVATHAKLLEAQTRMLCMKALGYEPQLFTDWEENAVNNISNIPV